MDFDETCKKRAQRCQKQFLKTNMSIATLKRFILKKFSSNMAYQPSRTYKLDQKLQKTIQQCRNEVDNQSRKLSGYTKLLNSLCWTKIIVLGSGKATRKQVQQKTLEEICSETCIILQWVWSTRFAKPCNQTFHEFWWWGLLLQYFVHYKAETQKH